MKYKPCCGRRCMVAKCETKEQGACYCICRMHDSLRNLESIVEGRTLYDGIGMQYIPDDAYRQKIFHSWSLEKQDIFKKFQKEAPTLIEKYKAKLKEYEIDG